MRLYKLLITFLMTYLKMVFDFNSRLCNLM